LTWGGDNTGTGAESVLLDTAKFKAQNQALTQMKIDFRVFWYSTPGTQPVSIRMTLWKGGQPVQGNYTWTNPTSTNVQIFNSTGKVITSTDRGPGERLAVVSYNFGTFAGGINDTDTTNYGFVG
jgi:hypothetical protein